MLTVAIFNQKGGVGKTTTAINLGAALAGMGKRVLLVDLDPAAHLTFSLGLTPGASPADIGTLLHERSTAGQTAISHGDGLFVIPGSHGLMEWESGRAAEIGTHFQLKRMLTLAGIELALLDCPPTTGLLALNALVAADAVLIPVQAEYLALQAIASLFQLIGQLRKEHNPGLEIMGILLTRYDERKVLNREVAENIRGHYPQLTFRTMIRENISLAEAPGFGQTIYEYKASCAGANDYRRLCQEIIERKSL